MARDWKEELDWLKANPAFEERPASMAEFLGPDYLDIEGTVRPRIREELIQMFGEEVNPIRIAKYSEAIFTGGIGIGKTTVAAIVLSYMCHYVLCLKDPQKHYGLMPGSRIAFMMMSTSESQALEVVYGDTVARIKHSKWFRDNYPHDPKFTKQIRFPQKDIWIIPGDSGETTFEGYNILGGVLDEGDSHKITARKDYAEEGRTTISSRITSRFQDRGFLLIIGQMKKAVGFMARTYQELASRPDGYAARLTIWESMGPDFYKDKDGGLTFDYDVLRKQILPAGTGKLIGNNNIITVPELYRRQFELDPVKALRDLAGIPQKVGNPFIPLVDRILDCRDKWAGNFGESYVTPDGRFTSWCHAQDGLPRVAHVDIGVSDKGDALGLAMGHVRQLVEIDGETKPYVCIDVIMRIKAPTGGEIMLSDVRQIIYDLRDKRKFRLMKVTFDGFQSTDSMQQLQKRGFHCEYVSVDKTLLAYSDLREAIYEGRLEFPPYITNVVVGDSLKPTEILVQELSELVETGTKIDHPEGGSKDVADAVAAVVTTLVGDRRYQRNARRDLSQNFTSPRATPTMSGSHPAYLGDPSIKAPLPPLWR